MEIDILIKKLLKVKNLIFIDELHREYPQATVFLVGGAIRDFILNLPILPSDLDFVVEGIDKDELEKFLGTQGIVKDVESRAFGVFIFVPKGEKTSFDIAIPRTDKWTGEGYKDVKVDYKGRTLVEDLARRDFTINALAIDLRNYKLIDQFGGQKNLEDKIIKAVGNAEERFQEDPSRILRGVRFAIQLDFKIEVETKKAMKILASEIRQPIEELTPKKLKSYNLQPRYRVAEEVIAKEFLKAFAKNPVKTLKFYDEVGLLQLLLPEVKAMQKVEQPQNFHSEGDVFEHTLLALKKLENQSCHSRESGNPRRRGSRIKCGMTRKKEVSINLKLAALFHDIGKPVTFTSPKDKNDRIHFNEHDEKGAEIAAKIIDRLKLNSFAKDSPLYVDKEIVIWLVRKHMILVTAKPEEMRLTTFEKYFFREDGAGDDLLRLSWADISATVPPSGKPDFSIYDAFIKKIEEVRSAVHAVKKERTLPLLLINGNDVMKTLKIKSGPEVGRILNELRELQLEGKIKTKKEAIKKLQEKCRKGKK